MPVVPALALRPHVKEWRLIPSSSRWHQVRTSLEASCRGTAVMLQRRDCYLLASGEADPLVLLCP